MSLHPILVTPNGKKVQVDQDQMRLNTHRISAIDEEFDQHEINVNPSQIID